MMTSNDDSVIFQIKSIVAQKATTENDNRLREILATFNRLELMGYAIIPYAIVTGYSLDIIKLLHEKGAELDSVSLSHAIFFERTDVVEYFITTCVKGPDCNYIELVRLLIGFKAYDAVAWLVRQTMNENYEFNFNLYSAFNGLLKITEWQEVIASLGAILYFDGDLELHLSFDCSADGKVLAVERCSEECHDDLKERTINWVAESINKILAIPRKVQPSEVQDVTGMLSGMEI